MNFDTRTVFDLFIIDPDLEIIVNSIVDAEKSGKTSENDFVRSVIPFLKDEIKLYLTHRTYKLKLGFLSKMINLDKVDYYHLIPAVCKI